MGIVAFCPNGHRINVKESYAGRKGLCPTCGAKFRIPAGDGIAAADHGLPVARLLDVSAEVVATLPRVLSGEGGPAQPHSPHPSAPSPPTLHPALAERPDLKWCIAFPGGDPTEPLGVESMQAWLESGQVEGSEVVWRSDWPEWRPVGEVFPDR
ncbi:MAG: DUF4339 domain-containing protein [Planctomycetia bacterium]|nr:DUF4339 domain-containing protein [Planctomycetia bacterium]